MLNYVNSLKNDLLEQFKEKPHIESLCNVLGKQLNELFSFYEQIEKETDVFTAVGAQLDGVGDIAGLTRTEAGILAKIRETEIMDDDKYRHYLIYKILKNTCDCTYPDIIKAFKMFWKHPLYYSEDPAEPATMTFDTGEIDGFVDPTPLFKTPLIRPAGVTLKLKAATATKIDETVINVCNVATSIMETTVGDLISV